MAGSEDQANSPHSIIRGGYCSYLIFFFFFPSCNAWTAWLWMITDEYGVVASDKPSPNA